MTARILEVADAVVANVLALWAASATPPAGADAVTRVYEVQVEADAVAGRQVYVFPSGWAKPEAASRREDVREHKLSVLIVERYTGAAPTPNAWMDPRVTFVEQVIWRPLADPRRPQVLTGVYPWESDVVAYDVDELVQRKLFLSLVNVTLRENI